MLAEQTVIKLIRESMTGPPQNYKNIMNILSNNNLLILTEDGTYTIRSEAESEYMHSRIGAMKEAFEKFATPSDIGNIKKPRILDLCSGLGYNSLAALVQNRDSYIDLLEISSEMIFLSQFISSPFKEKKILDEAVNRFFHKKTMEKIRIFSEDARVYLQRDNIPQYDIIFHDGFSPANDPLLYTVEFLGLLYKHMSSTAVLLSYSSSIPFRSALIEAGFHIGEGPSIGRKRGITIAAINKNDRRILSRLSYDDEKLIALSTIGVPFHDRTLKGTLEEIENNRMKNRQYEKSRRDYLSSKKIKKDLVDNQYRKIYSDSTNSRDSILAMREYKSIENLI